LYIRNVLFTSKLALAAALCYMVVHTLVPPRQGPGLFTPSEAGAVDYGTGDEPNVSRPLSGSRLAGIIEKNIFAPASKSASDTVGPIVGGGQDLGLVLLGTVAGEPYIGRAIIKDLHTNVAGLYRVGETVAQARIEAINKDSVILNRGGERVILYLGAGVPQNTGKPLETSSSDQRKQGLETRNDSSGSVQSAAKTKITDVASVLRKATIKPYAPHGRMEGLKITGIDKIPIAGDLGLRDGDVIRSVNGNLLTSKQKAYQVFKKARSAPTITIELLRGEQVKKLSFSLR